MSFITWQYFLFLPVIFLVYWQLPPRLRLFLLLAASYFFYGCWDVRFLALVLTTTVVDYVCGLSLGGRRLRRGWVLLLALLPAAWLGVNYLSGPYLGQVSPPLLAVAGALGLAFFAAHEGVWAWGGEKKNKGLLILSVGFCLAVLGFFKYFNFFVDSAQNLLGLMGLQANFVLLHIILPVGISFYTFQSLGYVIDVYRGASPACADFLTFATFDAFFPQMVSGPIERGKNLIPQLEAMGIFHNSYVHDGLRLILVGLFKKVFVADNCAVIAGYAFDPQTQLNGPWAILGVVAFAFQIYGDFSGYTDIARGSAKLLGIDLMENFRFPYSARNPSDFWSRWHISLSTWFRDYLYIPLGGNRGSRWDTIRNVAVTMLLAGLWHGASWIFVIWGAYHGALLILYRHVPPFTGFMAKEENLWWRQAGGMALMFGFTLAGWAIFRSANLAQLGAWGAALGHWQAGPIPWQKSCWWLLFHIAPLLLLQTITWKQRGETNLAHLPWPVRGVLYTALLLLVVSSSEQDQEFIYFQF